MIVIVKKCSRYSDSLDDLLAYGSLLKTENKAIESVIDVRLNS